MNHTDTASALVELTSVDEDLLDAASLLSDALAALEHGDADPELPKLRAVLVQAEELLKASAHQRQDKQPQTATLWLDEAAGLHASILRLYPAADSD
ncbi:hypothetical protein [Streptomyces sp. NPDC059009]|uniref:hypothetical protein n=1 Tax=Streptomyces sp. NPDC059009 TaxID=3346694 RepID=UPI00369FC8F7